VIPAENSAVFAGRIPNAERLAISRAGHLFWVERGGKTGRALAGFLTQP